MPELPELEVMREILTETVVDRPIDGARVFHPGLLKTFDPPLDALSGRTFESVSRRGKHLILRLTDDLHLVLHLMLAGRLVPCKSDTKVTKATGLVIRFADGEDLRLVENGTQRRVRVHVVTDPNDVPAIASAGVEALSDELTIDLLVDAFDGLRRQAKKAITDQRLIAGIGSAYADEILFDAKLSPIRYASTMERGEIERLHRSIGTVLRGAIEEIRASSDGKLVPPHKREFAKVVDRTGQPCPACGARIAEIRYAQTRTYYCPDCQASGKTLPDRRSWLTR